MRLEDFRTIARAHRRGMIPFCRELVADTLTPVMAFLRLRAAGRRAFLLESVEGGERVGRYSFLGVDPFQTVTAVGTRTSVLAPDGSVLREHDKGFFDAFTEELEPLRAVHVDGLPPFSGGAVGYLGYDAVRLIERLPDRHPREGDMPDVLFNFHDQVVAFDHAHRRVLLLVNARLHGDEDAAAIEALHARTHARLDAIHEALRRSVPGEEAAWAVPRLPPGDIAAGMRSNFSRGEFEAAVRAAKEYIAAGDIFQVVLSQRFEKEVSVDPFSVYRILRTLNPSPYLFFLDLGEAAVFGSSPELLVRVQDRVVSVRPIAGTRRRGRTEEEDRRLEEELLADEKELAEHRMLVDLGRNDVGRVARFGTVRLPHYLTIERYSHVMHIVSQVDGDLRDELTALDAFKAGFPAGTVSGAPKIRAMEIIDQLEPSRRGVYSGAVGYVDFSGNLDTGIAIRTIVFDRGRAMIQAGAGIVADSVPEREYRETIHKAAAVYEAIRLAEKGAAVADGSGDGSGGGGEER